MKEPLLKDNKNSRNNTALREEAEKRLSEDPQKGQPHDEPDRLIHELQVHQIELEMQNEELQRSRLETEKARDKYADFYDFAPVGYLTLDEKGMISELNLAAAGFLGIERKHLVNTPFSRFIQPESQDTFNLHKQVLHSSAKQTCELVLKKHDGTLFHAQLDSIEVKANGQGAMRIVLTDITDRKYAEERTKHLASFPQLSPNPLIEVDVSGNVIFTNPTAQNILQYFGIDKENPKAFLPKDMDAILRNWDKQKSMTIYREIAVTNRVYAETIHLVPQFKVARIYARDITSRKLAKARTVRQAKTMEGINRIFQEVMSSHTEEDLGRVCLAVAEEVTGSKFGFMGQIGPDGSFHAIALSDPGWEACKMMDPAGQRKPPGNFKIHGVYGRVLKGGKGFFTNDPASHPDRVGLPFGHPPLSSFLGVPLIDDGRAIGMIAVANREGGYTSQELEALETLAPAMVGAFRRKQAEGAHLRAEEAWERTFACVPDLIAILDNQHRVLRVNEAMAQRLGVKAEDAIGLRCYEAVHGLSKPPAFCPHSRTIKDGGQHIEEVHEDRLGGDFVVSTIPLHDDRGQTIGTVHVAHDITERKKVEEALRKAHGELEKRVEERTAELIRAYEKLETETAERAKVEDHLRQSQKMEAIGTLAGGIAHDFNNILSAILGFTEMAEEDAADRPAVQKSLQNVLKSTIRARDLVKQILAFSRKTGYERSPISLSPLITETTRFLRASIPATIQIISSIRATSDTVLASATEVQQILMNLATNASLAMEKKGGTLEIDLVDINFAPDSPVLEPDVVPGEYVQLVVKDTGIGMSPDVMRRAFEPFFTTRGVGKGTGMGLAVVYGIAKNLQGTITVDSEPGVGSTFRVSLPKVKAEAKEEQLRAVQVPRGTERILFVDDEEMLVEWGQATLGRLGYSVIALTDPTEALKTFCSGPSRFDLVITDQTMHSMTGMHLAKQILKIRPDIPIILCTGHSDNVSPGKTKEAGIRQFLAKPLAKRELAEAVRKVLDEENAA